MLWSNHYHYKYLFSNHVVVLYQNRKALIYFALFGACLRKEGMQCKNFILQSFNRRNCLLIFVQAKCLWHHQVGKNAVVKPCTSWNNFQEYNHQDHKMLCYCFTFSWTWTCTETTFLVLFVLLHSPYISRVKLALDVFHINGK